MLGHRLGKGLLHRLGDTGINASHGLIPTSFRQTFRHFAHLGFHRGHLLDALFHPRVFSSSREGAADRVGAPHELHITEAAGFISIEEKALISIVSLTRLLAEAIKQTHDCPKELDEFSGP